MDKPSLKKEIISEYLVLTLTEGFSDNKLILVTPAGIIYGNIANEESEDITEASLAKLSLNVANTYRSTYGIDDNARLDGNDGFISLKNATVRTANATFNLHYLNVFYDQIIGVTVGKLQ